MPTGYIECPYCYQETEVDYEGQKQGDIFKEKCSHCKEEFEVYFEFERPDNTLMSYFGVGIEYFIFPLVLIVALLSSIKLNNCGGIGCIEENKR